MEKFLESKGKFFVRTEFLNKMYVTIAPETRFCTQNQVFFFFFLFFCFFFLRKKYTFTHGDAGKSRQSRFPRFFGDSKMSENLEKV